MRIDTLTPVLDAAPGELVVGRVRVVNDGDADAVLTLRVVGLDGGGAVFEVPGGPLGPGEAAEVEVPLEVPPSLGVGQHAVALEVSSDRPDERPALARLTVAVDSLERVQMAPSPSTVRGGRSARFTLDVVNNEASTVDVVLGAAAADVVVSFEPSALRLRSGERGWVRGRIHARRRWSGEPVHHVIELTARGRSSTASSTMAYLQRPVIPGTARNAVLGAFIVVLFAGLLASGLWWWSQRDAGGEADARRAADGSLDPLDGTGAPGVGPGAPGSGDDTDAPGAVPPAGPGAIPTFTVVAGTVSVADGDSSGVTVRLAPIDLGADPGRDAGGQVVAFSGRSPQRSKIWSARHAERPSAVSPVRETESVPPMTTDAEGVWRFVDVPIRGNYELLFSKPGYDSRAYVVSPPDDGSRVELDVELRPGSGVLSGTVVGPDGPLGGVDITVTDGDLVFRTTSATAASGAGQVGSFAIEALNTPAVYTLTAELRGFGTEVVQLPFGPGEARAGVTVSMREGVGSISGRISSGARPRGGVTVTASNGDDTFTTTSLTEGDVGFYSIPRLDVPGEYTVTATVGGFITQTRRVILGGNATGVDFEMVPTTGAITGRVVSDNGNPIVGAGVTVSIDDISVRGSTAAAPVPGTFNVDDLPPGTYLIRISRFDHLPFAQQVTLRAGQTVDLGTIVMEFTDRPPIPALGSLAVRVLDSEDAELRGATVSLYAIDARVGVDEPLRRISDDDEEQSSFVFENVAVGTYRVRVERPIYRPVERRVSIGLARESIEVRLFRLGQASGQIVTQAGQPLRDYEVTIYRIDGPGVETFVESRVVVAGTRPSDGEILWESTPRSLITGLYRLEVTRQPPGFHVSQDQIIDPTVEETPAAMLFRVPPDSEEPVRVGDLVADPYPLLGGRFFVPRFDGQTTSMEPLDEAEVAAIDGLEVTLTCGGRTGTASIPPIENREQVRPYEGFVLAAPPNHFEYTPFQLQSQQLVGSGCVLNVSADGYVDTTVTLASALAPAPGAPDPRQRTVNVALIEQVDPFFGDVGWVDAGPGGAGFIPVGGVTIGADDVVTGSTPRQGDTFAQTTGPRIDRSTLAGSSAADGTWRVDGQVYGAATYRFDHPLFGSAQVLAVIDGDGRDVTSLIGSDVIDRGLDGWRVILTEPVPGTLRGQVDIRTTATPDFDDVEVSGAGPGTATFGPLDLAGLTGNPRVFEVEVAAGNWQVDFGLADNHAFFQGAPDRVTRLVEPAAVRAGFDTTMVELGLLSLDVALVPTEGAPQPDDAGSYTLRRDGAAPGASPVSEGAIDATVTVDRLDVDGTDPVNVAERYRLDVSRVGYDEASADVTITTPAGRSAVPVGLPAPTSSLDVALDLYAGTQVSVTVVLEQYGTITGTVLGRTFPGNDTTLYFDPDSDTDLLEVTAGGVDAAGQAIDADRILVYPTASAETSFLVTGPPGTYDITVSHPVYQPVPVEQPDPASFDLDNLDVVTVADAWVLQALTGTIELTALGSFGPSDPGDGGAPAREPIDGAVVTLSRPSDPGFADVVATTVDGLVTIGDLVPGTYRLEVRRRDANERDIAYPVFVDLVVPTGVTAAERTVAVTVKMPSLAGSITGDLTATNSLGEPVDAPTPVTITRTYAPTGVEIVTGGGTPVTTDNQAVDADVTAPDPAPGEPAFAAETVATVENDRDLRNLYGFGFVPGGRHELTFGVPDGYSLGTPGDADADRRTVDVDDVVDGDDKTVDVTYDAIDRTVRVTLSYPSSISAGNRDATVRLGYDPTDLGSGGTDGETVWIDLDPVPGSPDTFAADVPPRVALYLLSVEDEPYARPSDASPTTVEVRPGAAPVPVTVTMVADRGTISGSVQQQVANAAPGALQGPATITLTRGAADTFVAERVVAAGESVGTFAFQVSQGGTHHVIVTKDGFTTARVSTSDASPGQSVAVGTLTVLQKHTVVIPVASSQVTGASVTAVPVGNSPQVTPQVGSNTWTFVLEPDSAYRFGVQRAGHYTTVLPSGPGGDPLVAPLGGTDTRPEVTLVRRVVDVPVNVVGAANGQVAVTATMAMSGGPFTRTADVAVGGTGTLTFTSTDDPGPISLTAAATEVSVAAPGYRTRTLTATDFTNPAWPIGAFPSAEIAPTVTQAQRTQALSTVSLYPNVTSVTGTVTGVGAGTTVTLRRCDGQGSCTQVATTTTVDDAGTIRYTFAPPATPGHFVVGSYVAAVDVPGTGAGSVTFDITATAPQTATSTVPSFAVTAQDVTVTVTVTGPTNGVTIFDGTTNVNATRIDDTNQWRFTRIETAVAVTYEIRAAGHVWTGFTVSTVPASRQITASVTLPAFPDVSGTITDPDGTVDDAVVAIHRDACGSQGAIGTQIGSGTTGPDGSYTLAGSGSSGGPAGDHCITASKNAESTFGTVTLSVSNGTASVSGATSLVFDEPTTTTTP